MQPPVCLGWWRLFSCYILDRFPEFLGSPFLHLSPIYGLCLWFCWLRTAIALRCCEQVEMRASFFVLAGLCALIDASPDLIKRQTTTEYVEEILPSDVVKS